MRTLRSCCSSLLVRLDFLASLPVSAIWGVGKAMQAKLARDGIRQVAQLQKIDEAELFKRYDSMGLRLARLARGQDNRKIVPSSAAKSISSETTFNEDMNDVKALEKHLEACSFRILRDGPLLAKVNKSTFLKSFFL